MERVRQIVTFLGVFAVILGLTHFYLFERLSFYLQTGDAGRMAIGAGLVLLAFLTVVALPLSRILPRPAAGALGWIVFPWMGISLVMLVTFALTDIAWIAAQFVSNAAASPQFRWDLGLAAVAITGLVSGVAILNGLIILRVKPVSVTLDRLPRAFDGLRIVQITDLHVDAMIRDTWLRNVVARVNALNPDIIVITGDLIDGSVAELRDHVAPIGDLRARHGVYFITGNHEYYSGVDEWCAYVAQLGVKVLRNARVTITAGADSFDLAGVDDWGARHFPGGGPDLPKALAGRDPTKALLLLAHQPAAVDEAAAHGVDLQLSGHTHGGQIWPFNYLVYLQQPYDKGLYRHKQTATQIYVSPGTGFWGPPMRLGTVAEITHITLRAGQS